MIQVKTKNVNNLARDIQRAVGREADRVLRVANRKIANEVRDKARARARTEYGRNGSYGRAARAIQSRATPTDARVRLRKASDPRIFGAEFGSIEFRQFRGWRGNQWLAGAGPKSGVGFAVFPTFREEVPAIREEYADRMMDALAVAFPNR